jgi:hypothetical protein
VDDSGSVRGVVRSLEVLYADGWSGAVVNPLSHAEARARDDAGEPYAVLLLAEGGLRMLLHLSWCDLYCQVSRFDEQRRQVATHQLRGAAHGELFRYESRTWDGPAEASEFEFPHIAARHWIRHWPDGRRVDVYEPLGDRGSSTRTESHAPPPRLPRPRFGEWQTLIEFAGHDRPDIVDAVSHQLPVVLARKPPWRPPRPAQPGDVESLFIDGSMHVAGRRPVRIDLHQVGRLRMPSGRLIGADPSWLGAGVAPYTVTVPPGTYPVTVSMARFVDDPRHTRIAAARLHIAEQPAVNWEMALRAGEDPFALGFQQFYGIGVDASMACFVDADEQTDMVDEWRSLDGLVDPRFAVAGDGAMIAWSSGWGDGAYPVWIGRDAHGAVVCVLADMQLIVPDTEEEAGG